MLIAGSVFVVLVSLHIAAVRGVKKEQLRYELLKK